MFLNHRILDNILDNITELSPSSLGISVVTCINISVLSLYPQVFTTPGPAVTEFLRVDLRSIISGIQAHYL